MKKPQAMNNIPYTCVLALMLATMSMGLQAEAQTVVLDTSNVVVGYHYSCNTKDAEGRAAIDEYDIALLIGKKIVAQKGFCELSLDEDDNDDYVRILTERQHHVPEIYIGFPDEDKVTIRETVLMDDFEMVEKKGDVEWLILSDTIQINGHTCKKATANVRGRQWTAWFAEELPMPYGPWLLGGLPGLILCAESDDIHKFHMTSLSAASYPIEYEKRIDIMRTSRKKFIKYRDGITNNPTYLTNPSSLISPDIERHKTIYQFGNGIEFVEMKGHVFNPHPNVFIPLDLE